MLFLVSSFPQEFYLAASAILFSTWLSYYDEVTKYNLEVLFVEEAVRFELT